ncbi:hypothetical protein ACVWY2_004570 [Bradyrhizobium sp. JR6.1]
MLGAEKGGVGSRALIDYLFDRPGRVHAARAFDTEAPAGILRRLCPQLAGIVALTKSDCAW